MIISLDTETTGKDMHHGALPFFVTTCDDKGQHRFWGPPDWSIDPVSRVVTYAPGDLEAIQQIIDDAELIVIQNAKFDVSALNAAMGGKLRWPWEKVRDTLLASHLLYSAPPHDLTALCLQYLSVDITPQEQKIKRITSQARKLVQADYRAYKAQDKKSLFGDSQDSLYPFADWAIAKEGRSDMPSAGKEPWKYDMWLPRAILDYWTNVDVPWESDPTLGEWATALEQYSNTDSAVLLPLWRVMERELERRGLWKIYEERLKVLPITYEMEQKGITLSGSRLKQLKQEYSEESSRLERLCVNIASTYDGYELTLPKGGVNNSLREFIFDTLKLPIVGVTEKGEPSLNKEAIKDWELTYPATSREGKFLRSLKAKRQRDTAVTYMMGYERFWLPLPGEMDWFILYPFLNPTGTHTLRFSSNSPNEQNISKKEDFNLRYIFGPEPGWEWYSLDGKNLEARIPAYESGELELIALFEQPDLAPYYGSAHLLNFHTVYPDIWERERKEVGDDKVGPHCKKKYASNYYQWCKNGGFAIQYGAGERKTDATFQRSGAYKKLKSRFSKLDAYNQKWIACAEKYGRVYTTPSRKIDPQHGYPIVCSQMPGGGISPTIPPNYHVQSTAMEWTQSGMVRTHEQILQWRKNKFNARLCMQVHDEIVFAFPKNGSPIEDAAKYRETGKLPLIRTSNFWRILKLKELMEEGGRDIGLPTPVNIEYHPDNWAEGVTL